ncbi:T9SS type A sorting domain-containing protein [Flavobacterium wongokense]|uniref:T9SS type A sorting domain-containing protein n=1 Tax=Flavobacterium wongokense TaxID=2910674 RepID=UPI001F247AED|nr:T9SS type A sorting domain-containing protein [Flavobacterium sp. WG47]MCF6132440.1 T9SS type A sorting domain-containing protein [Flavobacterium sp. WG47]
MKKCCFLSLLILLVSVSYAQVINFPDANFKARLLDSSPSAGVGKDAQGNNITIDTNHNNEIEVSEALTVYGLVVPGSGISDLTGLDNFSNLTLFLCSANNLTDLSVVSALPNLVTLYCNGNSLTTLDLNSNLALETLECGENDLTSLEVGNCTNLKNLSCYRNLLTNLDTSNLIHLESLRCGDNFLSQLNVLNSPSLYELDFFNNQLTQIDLTGLGQSALATSWVFFLNCRFNNLIDLDTTVMYPGVRPRIECGYNPNLAAIYSKNGVTFVDDNPHMPPFPGLYIEELPSLQYICVDQENFQYVQDKINYFGYSGVIVDSNCALAVDSNEIHTSFSIYPNPARTILNLDNQSNYQVKSVTIYNLLAQVVEKTKGNNRIIDVSALATGTYLLRIETDNGYFSTKFIKE